MNGFSLLGINTSSPTVERAVTHFPFHLYSTSKCLLSTILNTILINKNSNYVNDNNNQGWNATLYTYLGLMNLCMTLWGGIELWDISCSELSRSNLWKASLVTFVINGVTTFVFVVSPPLLLCYLSNLFEGNTTIRSPTIDTSNV